MPRVKRGTTHVAKRKRLLSRAKGYRWGRKKTIKLAKTAVLKAGVHAYRGRKEKKRVNRSLWNIRISAALQPHGLSYSKFINLLKKKNIGLNRKVLSDLTTDHPAIFDKVVEAAKK